MTKGRHKKAFLELERIVSAGVTGTTLMTAFSYFISENKHRFFKEPELLNVLIRRLPGVNRIEKTSSIGWLLHYGVGLAFAAVYSRFWRSYNLKPTLASGIALGAASGVLGAATWKKTFEVHPDPPEVPRTRYLGHLFLAHLVFGAFSTMGYRFPAAPNKV